MKSSTKYLSFFLLILPLLGTSALAARSRTSTKYTIVKTNDKSKLATRVIDFAIYPYLSGDKKFLYIDFESSKLKDIEYIYYNLTYNTDNEATIRGEEGLIVPDNPQNFNYMNGVPFLRKKLLMGVCSKNVCTYWLKPRKFNLTARYKLKSAPGEITQVLTFE